jgi:hypothetical protein
MSQTKFDTSIAFENMTKCLQEIDIHITALARVFPNADMGTVIRNLQTLHNLHQSAKEQILRLQTELNEKAMQAEQK